MTIELIIVGCVLLALSGLALLFFTIGKVSAEESWASSLMTTMLLVFITGLVGNTLIAVGIVYVLAIAGWIFGILQTVRRQSHNLSRFFVPSIIMIWGIGLLATIAFHNMVIYNFDELYQWGKAADYMTQHDKLILGKDFSGESMLLSTTTLLHYFFARPGMWVQGVASASYYYVSNIVLWTSALILPFSGAGWKKKVQIWGFGAFMIILSAMIYSQPYYSIYTDQPTAFWSGAVIAWYVLKKCNKRNLYLLPLILINVGMMKSMVGPMFAVIALLSIGVVYAADKKYDKKKLISSDLKKNLLSWKGVLGLVVVISPLILVLIWSKVSGTNGVFRGSFQIEGDVMYRLKETIRSMGLMTMDSLNHRSKKLFLSYAGAFCFVLFMIKVIYPIVIKGKLQFIYKVLMYVYLAGFAVYFLVMLFAYMTIFGYEDSINAISVYRYYADYVMLGAIPLTIPLFIQLIRMQEIWIASVKNAVIYGIVIFTLINCGYFIPQNACHFFAVTSDKYVEREHFESYREQIDKYTKGKGKIYYINQTRPEYYNIVADYVFGDELTRGGMCFLFREEYTGRYAGLTEYPIETLPQVLEEQGYTHLWIYSKDSYLSENMKSLFDVKVKNGGLYEVVPSEKGVKLQYLGRVE